MPEHATLRITKKNAGLMCMSDASVSAQLGLRKMWIAQRIRLRRTDSAEDVRSHWLPRSRRDDSLKAVWILFGCWPRCRLDADSRPSVKIS